jgi:hypothetical protein
MSDFEFKPVQLKLQVGDTITSKKGVLFQSDMTGIFYRVTKFKIVNIRNDGSVMIERIKSEEVDAFPVKNE